MGLALSLPDEHVGILYLYSSIGAQAVILGSQVVDANFHGELVLTLWNMSSSEFTIEKHEKLAQLVMFNQTHRGECFRTDGIFNMVRSSLDSREK